MTSVNNNKCIDKLVEKQVDIDDVISDDDGPSSGLNLPDTYEEAPPPLFN